MNNKNPRFCLKHRKKNIFNGVTELKCYEFNEFWNFLLNKKVFI